MLKDSFGRKINYLRVSITDACNFKCVYCVPAEGSSCLNPADYLKKEHIVRFVKLAAGAGIERVRLTGGEPLLRHDLGEIVRGIKREARIRDLSITTNGSLLKSKLEMLKTEGLDRINISMDSLIPERFKRVTASDRYQAVYEAAFETLKQGFPLKLNVVAMKGLSEGEIFDFAALARDYPVEVRFLEFMPLCGSGWQPELVYPVSEIRNLLEKRFVLTEELGRGNQVARTYRFEFGLGRLGFIGSLTESFCDSCSRIRITADGRILPCLFSAAEVSVGELLKTEANDARILQALYDAVQLKPPGNRFQTEPFRPENFSGADVNLQPVMRGIGG